MDAPTPDGPQPDLKFLKALVTILTSTMIVGLVVVIVLLVIRLPAMKSQMIPLPDAILLPDGAVAQAFTQGQGWYAVVTTADQILIYEQTTGKLRQTIEIIR